MMPMFLTVYLSNSDKNITEVPLTPETLCRDVVDVCKEPGETDCYLAENWRGSERAIGDGERIAEVLQRWGQQRAEVRFVLRHDRAPDRDTGGLRGSELSLLSNTERNLENGLVPAHMDISVSELQEMALRQQQQINVQQQLLASKEQRLRFLKLQEQQHREQEKLRLLRENAENQEAKLRRVRALKGQVEQKRLSNNKLVEEIEQMNGLFQQKQRELVMAVTRVEELSRQLEMLRSGKPDEATELERLYKELQLRNKLNLEQSAKLQQQKECLNKRTQEVAGMDRRLAELRERLLKKKAALQQKENLPVDGQTTCPHPVPSRIAAVGPYIQSPPPPLPPKQDVQVKPAYMDGTATLPRPLVKSAGKMAKLSDWSFTSEISSVGGTQRGHASTLPRMSNHGSTEKDIEADLKPPPPLPPPLPLRKNQSSENLLNDSQAKVPPPIPSKPKPALSGFTKPGFSTGTFPGKARATHQLTAQASKTPMPAATVRPFSVECSTGKGPAINKPQTLAASSIYSMYTQHSSLAKGYQGQSTLTRSQPRVYGKPVIPTSGGQHCHSQESITGERNSTADSDQVDPGASSENAESERAPRPLSPTKLLPFLSHQHRLQSDVELEALRRRLQHAPRPLKKRGSLTEPEGPSGPNIQKLLYQKTTLAAMEMPEATTGGADSAKKQTDGAQRASDAESNGEDEDLVPPPLPTRGSLAEQSRGREPGFLEEDNEQDMSMPTPVEEYPPYPPPPYPSADQMQPDEERNTGKKVPEVTGDVTAHLGKRTNLRKPGSDRISHGMRVHFNPLALLLDASLEGEYDLVQRIIYEVEDPSLPNDEGITALHNAVCAGHVEIVKFLVQYGVNVNAADSDGWTPLHCAASCNNVLVCKFLVESGAAVFATTHSDMQTAAEKCEELEDGFAQCSQFLYGVQEKMGVMNRGIVYALWNYEAENVDEMSFVEGDCITVLRRDDGEESEWWWARCGDNEGYIPRNLLGLCLRIKPRQRSLA